MIRNNKQRRKFRTTKCRRCKGKGYIETLFIIEIYNEIGTLVEKCNCKDVD